MSPTQNYSWRPGKDTKEELMEVEMLIFKAHFPNKLVYNAT